MTTQDDEAERRRSSLTTRIAHRLDRHKVLKSTITEMALGHYPGSTTVSMEPLSLLDALDADQSLDEVLDGPVDERTHCESCGWQGLAEDLQGALYRCPSCGDAWNVTEGLPKGGA